jgi:hypothetical protein
VDRHHPTHAHLDHRRHALSRSELSIWIIFPNQRREKRNQNRLEKAPPLDDPHQYPRTRTLRRGEAMSASVDYLSRLNDESPILSPPYSPHIFLPGYRHGNRGESILSAHRAHHLVWV